VPKDTSSFQTGMIRKW